ncbi:uncharacterized protein [Oryza sativa Japonica Group]|jgi:hypothetical protein|uniref:Os03g0249800 protein n=8 Tax=Oryza TaxID=4527 RepID=A0A8J8Y6H7_ORYSJ|nr:uncharacterized protein LOC9272607 [Oryza sativa Japonica Group]XP_052146084.1 uncharacterized protein LOC127765260 [Oryza glaberrima]EAY89267.1 hypothetical protein OsI_10765 [Oryza sativa Indica Group]KAB8091096.1 hypothetical protein EE612_016512 [Oryza sativa]ABF94980.1 expressed protein [Oryza sativa Japonica Group]EAZ26280.1 hypothetical protein OsJ_10149 [Oryza sativa Japonica Group]KAF2938355.1 hypothetical protein DAI22_03g112100 [Oryza sativa Japonica Group]|eukprot:NP_001173349.1 Os03g0249800 [Oryza sativa Japonica Group]
MAYQRGETSSVVEAFTLSPLPYPVILILLMVMLLLGVSWFFTYEDFMEEAAEQLSWALLLVPVALVLLIRWISSVDTFDGYFSFYPTERRWNRYDPGPAEGSSPWGVAMVVLLLLVLASFHSTFQDMWKP